MSDDVVITGMGIISPIGCDEGEFWDSLTLGRTGAAPIDCLDTSDLSRSIGCQVKGDAWRAGINADVPAGRAARLAVAAAEQAMRNAGLFSPTPLSPPLARGEGLGAASRGTGEVRDGSAARAAVIIGTTMGETEFIENHLGDGSDDWLSTEHAREILQGRPGSISGHVAKHLIDDARANEFAHATRPDHGRDARATQQTHETRAESDPGLAPGALTPARLTPGALTSAGLTPGAPAFGGLKPAAWNGTSVEAVDIYGACAAGNLAIGAARRRLLNGECDVALAGGADGFSRLAFIGFMRLRVMAAEVCRPFDDARDGLFVGEGAAVFVLERESSAKARGARIRARILGAADACENYHPTRPHPEGDGLSRAITRAVEGAGISFEDVDYICAHGTGTPQNDAIEVGVMNRLFPAGTPFSSVKALTGHTMGAAAAVEAAACVLSLEHQTLIPTWHLDNVLQPCSLEPVKGGPRSARLRCVINNSAGFGGYNSSVVITAA